ncbi:MAG: hypothetical protein Q8O05_03610 [Chloroflexota bacterium]|nr:hypothetical protein [Chloroflexota bacterium]
MKAIVAITGPLKGLGYIIALPVFAVVAVLLLTARRLAMALRA